MSCAAAWVRRRLIAPVLQANAPSRQIVWGAGLGMFFALLPTVGQLYIVTGVWGACRYLLRRAFHLPTAILMVALVPPPLKLLTFYLYAVVGDLVLRTLGYAGMAGGYAEFQAAIAGDSSNWLTNAAYAVDAALVRFGPPIIVGGIIVAAAGGPLAAVCAWMLIGRYRRRTAVAAPSVEAP